METPSKEQWSRIDQLIEELEEYAVDELKERINALAARGEDALVIKYLRTHFRLPKDPWLQPGETLVDRYTILSRLGEGGMGVVYKAAQRSPYRNVALKVIHPSFAISRRFAERFTKEINNLGRLNHSGIVQIYEADKQVDDRGHRTTPFYTMELVDGEPVDRFCRSRDLSLLERLELVILVCEAVQHAHDRGLIHGDLKPPNILVRRDSVRPVILDFGLSRITTELLRQDEESRKEAASNMDSRPIGGTPGYMSPEQVNGSLGKMGMGYGIDVYALGVILYELIADCPPITFPENVTFEELSRQILTKMPRPLTSVVEDCDEELSYIVGKAIRKEANRRYLSVAAFQRALELHRDRVYGRWARTGRWTPKQGVMVPSTQWKLESKVWPLEGDSSAMWRMESLWLAHHEGGGEPRVLRFFSDELVARAIKRDPASLRMLESPFDRATPIQTVFGGSLDDEPFYTVESPVEGMPLSEWLETYDTDMAVPEAVKLWMLHRVAVALSVAHREGVVHGSFSASCIFVDGDPFDAQSELQVTVVGFALRRIVAKFEADFRPALDPNSSVADNTLAFESPETLEGMEPNFASDVFSLGVLYYKLIVGDLSATAPRRLEDYPIERLIAADIESCLATRPEARMSSAGELAARIESLPARREAVWRDREDKARLKRRAFQKGFAVAASIATGVVGLIAYFAFQATIKKNVAVFQEALSLQRTTYSGRRARSIDALQRVGDWGVRDSEKLSALLYSFNLVDIDVRETNLPQGWDESVSLGVFGPGLQRVILGSESGRIMVAERGGKVLFDVAHSSPSKPVFATLTPESTGSPLLGVTHRIRLGYAISVFDIESKALIFYRESSASEPPPIAFGGPYAEFGDEGVGIRYLGFVDPDDGDLRVVDLSTFEEQLFQRRGSRSAGFNRLDLISPRAPTPAEVGFHPSQPFVVARYEKWTLFAHAWDLRPEWPDNRDDWRALDWVGDFPNWGPLRQMVEAAGVLGRRLRPVRRSLRLYHRSTPVSLDWDTDSENLQVYTERGSRYSWDLADGFEMGRRGHLDEVIRSGTGLPSGSRPRGRRPFPEFSTWGPILLSTFFRDQYPGLTPQSVTRAPLASQRLLATTADGGAYVGVDDFGRVHVLDQRYGQSVEVDVGEGLVTRIRGSAGGAAIALDTRGMPPVLLDYDLGSERVAMESSGYGLPVTSMAFLGGDQVLVAASGGVMSVFDAEFGRELARVDDLMTRSLHATSQGGLVSAGAGGAFAWRLEKTPNSDVFRLFGEETLNLPDNLSELAGARDRKVVVATHRDHIHGAVYGANANPLTDDFDPGRTEWTSPDGHAIERLRLSSSGRWLAMSSTDPSKVLVSAWDFLFTTPVAVQDEPSSTPQPVKSLSGLRVLSGSGDAFLFAPVSETLLTVSQGQVRGWQPGTWKRDGPLDRAGIRGAGAMAFSPDERLFASLSRKDEMGVALYDWQSKRELARLPVDANSRVTCLALGPDSRRLAIGFENGEIIVWDLARVDDRAGTRISPVRYAELPLDFSEPRLELAGLSNIDRLRAQRQGLVEAISEEVRRSPELASQLNNLAVNQAYVGSLGLAITNMLDSLESPGGSGHAGRWANLARIYWRVGDSEKARLAALNAVAVQPDDFRAEDRDFEFLAFLFSMGETEPPASTELNVGAGTQEVAQRIRGPRALSSEVSARDLAIRRFAERLKRKGENSPISSDRIADAEALAIAKTLEGNMEEAMRLFGKFDPSYRSISGWTAYWVASTQVDTLSPPGLSSNEAVRVLSRAVKRDGYTMDFRRKLFDLLAATMEWGRIEADEAWALTLSVGGIDNKRALIAFEGLGAPVTVEGALAQSLVEARLVSRATARSRIRDAAQRLRSGALACDSDTEIRERLISQLAERLNWTQSERRRWRNEFLGTSAMVSPVRN